MVEEAEAQAGVEAAEVANPGRLHIGHPKIDLWEAAPGLGHVVGPPVKGDDLEPQLAEEAREVSYATPRVKRRVEGVVRKLREQAAPGPLPGRPQAARSREGGRPPHGLTLLRGGCAS